MPENPTDISVDLTLANTDVMDSFIEAIQGMNELIFKAKGLADRGTTGSAENMESLPPGAQRPDSGVQANIAAIEADRTQRKAKAPYDHLREDYSFAEGLARDEAMMTAEESGSTPTSWKKRLLAAGLGGVAGGAYGVMSGRKPGLSIPRFGEDQGSSPIASAAGSVGVAEMLAIGGVGSYLEDRLTGQVSGTKAESWKNIRTALSNKEQWANWASGAVTGGLSYGLTRGATGLLSGYQQAKDLGVPGGEEISLFGLGGTIPSFGNEASNYAWNTLKGQVGAMVQPGRSQENFLQTRAALGQMGFIPGVTPGGDFLEGLLTEGAEGTLSLEQSLSGKMGSSALYKSVAPAALEVLGQTYRYEGEGAAERVAEDLQGLQSGAAAANLSMEEFSRSVVEVGEHLEQFGTTIGEGTDAAIRFSRATGLIPETLIQAQNIPMVQAGLGAQGFLPWEYGLAAENTPLISGTIQQSLQMYKDAYSGALPDIAPQMVGGGLIGGVSSEERAIAAVSQQTGMPPKQVRAILSGSFQATGIASQALEEHADLVGKRGLLNSDIGDRLMGTAGPTTFGWGEVLDLVGKADIGPKIWERTSEWMADKGHEGAADIMSLEDLRATGDISHKEKIEYVEQLIARSQQKMTKAEQQPDYVVGLTREARNFFKMVMPDSGKSSRQGKNSANSRYSADQGVTPFYPGYNETATGYGMG